MLQKIPEIVDEEFRDGHIDNRKALFTIGLSHIPNIMKYLKQKKIVIRSPLFTPVKHGDYVDELNLANEDFGMTVILPRTLVDDHEAMTMNKLKTN